MYVFVCVFKTVPFRYNIQLTIVNNYFGFVATAAAAAAIN